MAVSFCALDSYKESTRLDLARVVRD